MLTDDDADKRECWQTRMLTNELTNENANRRDCWQTKIDKRQCWQTIVESKKRKIQKDFRRFSRRKLILLTIAINNAMQ